MKVGQTAERTPPTATIRSLPGDWLGLWRARPGAAWDAGAERRVLCAWCYITLTAMRFFALAGQPHGPWARDQMLGRLAEARPRGLL